MDIRSLSPRPLCTDLPTSALRQQCALPPEHLAERKAAETGEVGHHALEILEHEGTSEGTKLAAEKVVGKLSFGHVVHAANGVLAPVLGGIDGTVALADFNKIFGKQAELRGKAVGRENHDLAMAFVAEQQTPGVFPKGYIDSRKADLMGPNAKLGDTRHTPHVVNRAVHQMETAVEAHDAGAERYVAYWAKNAGAGVREAQTRDIHDSASLETARKDKGFREAFDKDPAFREGVRAGMWQAGADPKGFAAAREAQQSLRDQTLLACVGRPQ